MIFTNGCMHCLQSICSPGICGVKVIRVTKSIASVTTTAASGSFEYCHDLFELD